MARASTMLNRLDVATRDFHAGIDARWLDLLGSGITREQYRSQLMRTYGFEAPIESALAYTPNLVVPDKRERSRSGLIAQDLLALGVSPVRVTELVHCNDIMSFRDPAEALGWKYVVERPTQLHGAIKRNVLAHFPDVEHACAYLSSCDGVAAMRWQQLGTLLDMVAERHRASERIVEAACMAFSCMTAWYASCAEAAA